MTEAIKTYFSKPADPVHIDTLQKLFDRAVKGSHIYVSLSKHDGRYSQLIEKAKANGAIVHTNYWWSEQPKAPRIHNKYFAFEALNYSDEFPWLQRHVICVTTGNVNRDTEYKHECMVRFQSKDLFRAFAKRWKEVEGTKRKTDAIRGWESTSEGYDQQDAAMRVKVYFFPMQDDIILDILSQVNPKDGGTLQLLVPKITNPRIGLARKLVKLADQGMTVRVITRPKGEALGTKVWGVIKGTAVQHKVCRASGRTWFHSRYFTIEGTYDGRKQKLTWMGTSNMTGPALHSAYETLLKIWDADDEVHSKCVENFAMLWDDYARVPTSEGHWPK